MSNKKPSEGWPQGPKEETEWRHGRLRQDGPLGDRHSPLWMDQLEDFWEEAMVKYGILGCSVSSKMRWMEKCLIPSCSVIRPRQEIHQSIITPWKHIFLDLLYPDSNYHRSSESPLINESRQCKNLCHTSSHFFPYSPIKGGSRRSEKIWKE